MAIAHFPVMHRIALVVLLTSLACGQNFPDTKAGTTLHLEPIFVGRCFERSPKLDCSAVYTSFFDSWKGIPSNSVSMQNYGDFQTQYANFSTPRNKAMFWSGSRDVVHELSDDGGRYWTLEDTQTGSVTNGLSWCAGTPWDTPAVNYTTCPFGYFDDGTGNMMGAEDSFWQMASTDFARGVQGDFSLLLAATASRLAYRRSSYFSRYELPNLNRAQVTKVDILMIRNDTLTPPEACGSGSLVLLAQDLASYGIPFTCTDNPDSVRHIICVDTPSSPQCRFATALTSLGASGDPDSCPSHQVSISVASVVAFATFLVGIMGTVCFTYVMRKRRRAKFITARRRGHGRRHDTQGLLVNAQDAHDSDTPLPSRPTTITVE